MHADKSGHTGQENHREFPSVEMETATAAQKVLPSSLARGTRRRPKSNEHRIRRHRIGRQFGGKFTRNIRDQKRADRPQLRKKK
jgi:hypothetical protein